MTAKIPATGKIDAYKGGHHKGTVFNFVAVIIVMELLYNTRPLTPLLFVTDHDSSKLSTAAIIGICAAGVFAFLIVIAVIVYWKKYHHRSRLRAAYYNDISMHDPLYEDFGPEVA